MRLRSETGRWQVKWSNTSTPISRCTRVPIRSHRFSSCDARNEQPLGPNTSTGAGRQPTTYLECGAPGNRHKRWLQRRVHLLNAAQQVVHATRRLRSHGTAPGETASACQRHEHAPTFAGKNSKLMTVPCRCSSSATGRPSSSTTSSLPAPAARTGAPSEPAATGRGAVNAWMALMRSMILRAPTAGRPTPEPVESRDLGVLPSVAAAAVGAATAAGAPLPGVPDTGGTLICRSATEGSGLAICPPDDQTLQSAAHRRWIAMPEKALRHRPLLK